MMATMNVTAVDMNKFQNNNTKRNYSKRRSSTPIRPNFEQLESELTSSQPQPDAADLYVDNWYDYLLTPENIKNIKKPLSPPRKREGASQSYSSLQEFILEHSRVKEGSNVLVTPTVYNLLPNTQSTNNVSTSPPRVGSPPERFAGSAFCNSPSPRTLPIPVFESAPLEDKTKQRSLSVPSFNHYKASLSEAEAVNLEQPKQKSEKPERAMSPTRSVRQSSRNSKAKSPEKVPTEKSRSFSGTKGHNGEQNERPSPTKKRSYVPKNANKRNTFPAEPPQHISAQVAPAVPTNDHHVPLEQMSNQLKMMLNIA